jgi:hypothetical protein
MSNSEWCSATADKANIGKEIRITPEMTRAGCIVFWNFDRRFDDAADVVDGIFRAMRSLEAR